jgi:anti-sigma regulatory factor (Ser/Thr protein kinase)
MAQVDHEFEFDADPTQVTAARHRVLEAAQQLGCSDLDGVQLAVSELIANAVEHGRGPVTIRASRDGDRLRIAVHDCGPGEPTVEEHSMLAERGRGMLIVSSLAASWGFDVGAQGKTVWAEFP